jgi:mRNA interferase MazF
VLTAIVVAPVTRTIRGIPTEVPLGPEHGLPQECVASFDNLQPIPRRLLSERVGVLGIEDVGLICQALRALADC